MKKNNIFGKISLSLLIVIIVTVCIAVSGCEKEKEYEGFTKYDYEHLYEAVLKWDEELSDALGDFKDYENYLGKMKGIKKLGNIPEFKEMYDECYPIFYKMAYIDERELSWYQKDLLHPLIVISEEGIEFLDTVKTKRDYEEAVELYEDYEWELDYFYNEFKESEYKENILTYGEKYVTDEDWEKALEEYMDQWDEYVKRHPDNKSNNKKKNNSSSKNKSKDPYDVNDFEHAEDLYEFYYDDFIDYEDAEDYYNEHFDD